MVQTEVSGTLGTGNDQTVICLGDTQGKAACDENMCGTLHVAGDPPTILVGGCLTPGETQARRVYGPDGPAPCLGTRERSGGNQEAVLAGSVVRRLTPLECERLQGFPDGWTDVPYKGKRTPPDGPRYKAIGNSMAVPVMRWIGERINAVDVFG